MSERPEPIPMLDLVPEIEEQWDDLMKAIEGVLHSGRFILGPNVEAFEQKFFATTESISNVGATLVFVDIDPVTSCVDPELIEAAITERTKAILPVHLYG